MTWIVAGNSLNHSFVISDVRVTWGNIRSEDCLQMIYPINNSGIVGFSGGVINSFALSEIVMNAHHSNHSSKAIYPQICSYLRYIKRELAHGFSLMSNPNNLPNRILYAFTCPQQFRNSPRFGRYLKTEIAVFNSPNFTYQIADYNPVAIGNGAYHPIGESFLNSYRTMFYNDFNHQDLASRFNASEFNYQSRASLSAVIMSDTLRQNQIAGVGNAFQVGILFFSRNFQKF
jgi:hypothetical protein